jgi:hypothetical protein
MRILVNENQLHLIGKSILLEYEVVPYEQWGTINGKYGDVIYRFTLNGLDYNVFIRLTDDKDVREISFNYDRDFSHQEQMDMSGTPGIFDAGKDIKHLNSVLYTVLDIMEDAVKKYKFRYIQYTGGRHKDEDIDVTTKRTKIYNRFITNRYPSNSFYIDGNKTMINMTKVFPDLFKDNTNSTSPPDVIFSIIGKSMGKSFTPFEIDRILYYTSDSQFRIIMKDITLLNGKHINNLDIDVDEDVFYLDIDLSDDYYNNIDSLYKGLIDYLS